MKKLALILSLSLIFLTCSKGDDSTAFVPKKFTISVSASEGGSVNTTGGEYNENSSVSITSTPEMGYEFSSWTGSTSSDNSISIKVTSNQTLTANFVRSNYTLRIETIGSGNISQQIVNPSRKKTEYESGSNIELTATPDNNFLFYNWQYFLDNNEIEEGFQNPFEVLMDQSKTITATFELKLQLTDPNNDGKNNTVGKWKIRKKGPGSQRYLASRLVACNVNDIIFRSDNSFTLITDTATLTGQYTIDSENTISLDQGETNLGRLTEVILSENFIRFNIELTEICDEVVEGDKDPAYDEASDPLAPLPTTETDSSTLANAPCSIEINFSSNNATQTISLGNAVQDIVIDLTIGSTCSQTLNLSSSNLPEGVTVNLDNNQVVISGTPSANAVGTFDFEIIINVESPTTLLNGQIIVEDNSTPPETNPNDGSENDPLTGVNNDNCQLEFTSTASNGGMIVGETITKEDGYFTSTIRNTDNPGSFSENCPSDLAFYSAVEVSFTGLPQGVNGDWDPATQLIYIFGTAEVSSVVTHTVVLMAKYESQVLSHSFSIEITAPSNNGDTTGNEEDTTDGSNTSTAENFTVNVSANNSNDYNLEGTDRNGSINGEDPAVTLNIGDTINFVVDAQGHPFYLKTLQGTGIENLIDNITDNGSTNATLSWTPTTAGTYYYQCSLHNNMYGTIIVN